MASPDEVLDDPHPCARDADGGRRNEIECVVSLFIVSACLPARCRCPDVKPVSVLARLHGCQRKRGEEFHATAFSLPRPKLSAGQPDIPPSPAIAGCACSPMVGQAVAALFITCAHDAARLSNTLTDQRASIHRPCSQSRACLRRQGAAARPESSGPHPYLGQPK